MQLKMFFCRERLGVSKASLVLSVEQMVLAVMKEKSCLAKRLWEATRKSAGLSWDLAGVSGKGS